MRTIQRTILASLPLALAGAASTVVHAQASAPTAAPAPRGAAVPAAARRPLTQDTYDSWRTIQQPALSPDGRWVAYTLTPVVGNGELVVAAAMGAARETRIARGYTGRPQLQPNADSSWSAPGPQWSADSRHVAFLAYATQDEYERARRARRRPAEQPRATLVIHEAGAPAEAAVRVPRVRSVRVSRHGGGWIAYQLESETGDTAARRDSAATPAAPAGAVAAATPGGRPRPIADSTGGAAPRRELGTTLVLRELATGREVRIEDVSAFALSDSGRWVGYTVASRDRARDGAYVRDLAAGREIALLSGAGTYKALAFDRAQRQVAFVAERGERPARGTATLYHAALGGGAARAVVAPADLGGGLRVADRGVGFSRDGGAVTFGVLGPAVDSIPADSLADKAVLDLWHWRDARLQPQQRLEAARDRDRSYLAVWRPDTRRVVRLANDSVPTATLSEDGRTALATTSLPYAIEAMWGEGGSDAWVIDARTGARRRIAERLPSQPQLAPGGRYVVWFRDGAWWAHDTRGGTTVNLTARLTGVRFDQETWDTPGTPAAWGVAGWTPDDRSVLVYSRFDVWELDPAGRRAPRVVTDSAGARARTELRVVDLDPESRYLDPRGELLLSAFSDSTKQSGFWRDRIEGDQNPSPIVMADARFGRPLKADRGATMLVTRQTVRDFPDLWTGTRLDTLERRTQANPQQAEYAWASVERVRWTSSDGVPLEGLLYKPEGFDSTRTHPMVVYFYERHSDDVHAYHVPTGRNVVNPIVYASKGYLVFLPDIAYTTGYPGQNALHAIVPGVHAIAARGFLDLKRVGIAGQSWGGYQAAYIVTQTPLFRAAMVGAPVANMTSAYGGIRWESGNARPFQYERGQSRIGGALWTYPMRFIENSPLFFADRVQTPMLIMHNDADGAVPWQQGIELFVALRRLQKEVYLVNYNGDGHNPRKRANQKDIDLRMQQFFDHHLRGAAAPEWMTRGIPFLQKGRDQMTPPATVQAAQAGATGAPQEPSPETPRP